MKKEYRPLKGFEKKYFIASDGEVKSFYQGKYIIIKQIVNKGGYRVVNIHDRRTKTKAIHTVASLVLETWGPPKPSKEHKVLHLDCNKLNCNIENLAWGTKADIMRRTVNKIKKTMRRRAKKRIIIVIEGQGEAARILRFNYGHLMNTGKVNRAGFRAFDEKGYEKWVNGIVEK
jgi:hypothetical protein